MTMTAIRCSTEQRSEMEPYPIAVTRERLPGMEEEQRDPALPEDDNIMEEKEDDLMDPTTIHAPADRKAGECQIAQTAEQTPEGFDAVERLYHLKDEREKLANLTGNTRFADDARALKYAVTVLEAVGL